MSFCPKIIIHGGGAAQVHMGGVATVEVGTVTTGAPGTEAQVTNSGTRTRAVLNFVIPRGADGKNADVVTVTEHENDEGEKYYTADKSYSQLIQARADGLVMKLRCVDFWQLNKELYEFDLRHVEGTNADDFVMEFGGTTVAGLLVYVTIANHPISDSETAGYILVSTKDAGASKEYVDTEIENNQFKGGTVPHATEFSGAVSVGGMLIGKSTIALLNDDADGVCAALDPNDPTCVELFDAEKNGPVKLGGIATPAADDQAANKVYVDSKDAEVVTVTQSVGSDGTATYTADKTFAQLMAAYTANRPLQLIFIAPAVYNAPLIIPLIATDETAEFGFSTCITVNNVVKTVSVQVANTGSGETWTCSVVKASDSSDAVAALGDQIGDLADLETTDKSNLVKAVNEARGRVYDDAGVTPVTYTYTNPITQKEQTATLFVEKGTLTQIGDDATDAVKLAWNNIMFVMGGTLIGININVTTNRVKSWAILHQAGLVSDDFMYRVNTIPVQRERISYSASRNLLGYIYTGQISCSLYYSLTTETLESYSTFTSLLKSTEKPDGTTSVPQFVLAADPTADMQVATKQYVDERENVQPDWSQNDETAKDYVKNRPCYKVVITGRTNAVLDFVATSATTIHRTISQNEWSALLKQMDNIYIGGVAYEASSNQNMASVVIGGPNLTGSAAAGSDLVLTSQNSDLTFVAGQTYTLTFAYDAYVGTEWTRMDGNYIDVDESLIVTDGKLGTATGRIYVSSDGYACGEIFNDKKNVASGVYSHAEGSRNTASDSWAHAEGYNNVASGQSSHAEGSNTKAANSSSHAEGRGCEATANGAHAEGWYSHATGDHSHAEGSYAIAAGENAHVEGDSTNAAGKNSHVQGKYNVADSNNEFAHIVGNGARNALSNAHTLDWIGNAWFAGDIYVGSTSGKNRDEGSKKLATEEYVDDEVKNAGGGDISLGLSGIMEPGEVPVVKTVDDNGVPTSWGTRYIVDGATGSNSDLVSLLGLKAMMPSFTQNAQKMDISGAKVGQTLKINAVNEAGEPIAWGAVDAFALLGDYISTAISSTSTDDELATAKAVYDAIAALKAELQGGGTT